MQVSNLISQTRRFLFSGSVEERNQLADALSSVPDTFNVIHDIGSIDRGAKVSINLEDMYVWSKSSQTVTVARGQFGSTVASHSAFDTIYVNPRFSPFEILSAINTELVSLSSPTNGLYTVSNFELTYNPVIQGYDFPHTVLDVFDVRYTTPGPSQDWFSSENWDYIRNAGSDFTSTTALLVRDAYPNQPINVIAKIALSQLPYSLTSNTTSYAIPDEFLDILSIGAAYRLTSPREVRRNFDETQGDTRRANEVPPGANLGGSRELGRLRQERIREEASRLNIKYPSRSPRYPFMVG
jgi:hypothetical protein